MSQDSPSARVLFIDDDRATCEWGRTGLNRFGLQVTIETDPSRGIGLLDQEDFDVLVTDLHMKEIDGIELCRRVAQNRPDLPVIVMTAFGSMESAIASIRAGAYDFIPKPVAIDQLALAIERAVNHRKLVDEVKRLRRAVTEENTFDEMIGESAEMRSVFDLLARVTETDATVLVTGESGTGKELIARALHRGGRRKDAPFVAVNCGAMPESLLESELFGHSKGAFTDAREMRDGLFVAAEGGTLFLDEIGEMPIGMQVKLLRALQERTVRPIGADRDVAFNTRLVTATNRDLEAEVQDGRFREDLFYRINVVHIHVPPLRKRADDVFLLARDFVERFARGNGKNVLGISKPAADKLRAYAWPGNVRELQNCMERAVALARGDQITVEDLPEKVRHFKASVVVVESEDPAEMLSMDEVEKRYILRVLEACGGNKTHAADILGVDRKTLYRKLERFG